MNKSESIKSLVPALLAAQKLMGAAKKGSSNPYFKSKYADLGAVLEACKDLLNDNGIVILQPHSVTETSAGTYATVETVLLHTSGESISSSTQVVVAKPNDPQAYGSAITYARRYGLQSLLSMPAEDDDGESAMGRKPKVENAIKSAQVEPKPVPEKSGPENSEAKTAPVTRIKSFKELKEESVTEGGANNTAARAPAPQTSKLALPSFRRSNVASKANGSANTTSKGGWTNGN